MTTLDLLVLEGGAPTAVAMTLDAAEAATRLAPDEPPLAVRLLSPRAGRVVLRGGLTVAAEALDAATPSPWVLVAGVGAATPEDLRLRLEQRDARAAAAWLRGSLAAGSQVAASCTGAFLLGEAGALQGRRCTTTWWLTALLKERYPLAKLEADALVVQDGPVWTAGASFAHADLVLRLLEQVRTPSTARAVAGRLLISARHSQAAHRTVEAFDATDPVVAAAESWALAHLEDGVSLSQMAQAAHVSVRTLARRFEATVGVSPVRHLQRLRVAAAVAALQTEDLPLTVVARRVGFADAASLSRAVRRVTGQAPGAFRAGSLTR